LTTESISIWIDGVGGRRVAIALALVLGAGCGVSAPATSTSGPRIVTAVATINAWGSILAQLGGTHVRETSIITNPSTDPHLYEPTPADGRLLATARLVVENAIGYDPWAARALAANPEPGRTVISVGRLLGISAGGNPHRWYSPGDVERVADAITAALQRLDPADSSYFATLRRNFDRVALVGYHQAIADIRARYAGTPVGASESIFSPLAPALGLDLVTPYTFLRAISEGSEPSAADLRTIAAQIDHHRIKVYVFNSQNSTPDVAAQVRAARDHGIPVTAITETLSPADATFQEWQTAQLVALTDALHVATGR
jgi:zinc/manganese transport system substrate-binding protein